MFKLPSIWNLLFSTMVFFYALWYVRRWCDEQDLPKGMTRSVLVFVLATVAASVAGSAIDFAHDKLFGPPPVSQAQKNLDALIKQASIKNHK